MKQEKSALEMTVHKSRHMEELYANNPDPWGNRKTGIYEVTMKEVVNRLKDHVAGTPVVIDIGCGGANVLDGLRHNFAAIGNPGIFYGVDISESAINWIKALEDYTAENFSVYDLERDEPTGVLEKFLKECNVAVMMEVMYYLGEVRPWRESMDKVWDAILPGTLVVVGDGLIPYQYRSYFTDKPDAELLESYTDTSFIIGTNTTEKGKTWNRYLKVKIFRKK